MKTFKSIQTIRAYIKSVKKQKCTIGFVPTMGALHDGHLSLVQQSKEQCHVTIVSIFINPTQFAAHEDFDHYPESFKNDALKLKKMGVDAVFYPRKDTIYPNKAPTIINAPFLSQQYCGVTRPDFFQGVCMVVLRLFNIIKPNIAFFGEKDFQQQFIIKKMVSDLFLDIEIKSVSIKRDPNGLALSSRNLHLSPKKYQDALHIFKALNQIKKSFHLNITNTKILYTQFEKDISKLPSLNLDYIAIINPKTLSKRNVAQKNDRVLCAVYCGKVRLIDNIVID